LSIVAMNWAWRQALMPTLKLVLMALADAADDQGVCWPSVSTLAKKCTVSTRTVQRSLRTLIDRGLLIAEPRQRRDGSSTSNCYRLLIAGGDNLSPPSEADDTPPGQGCRGDPDMPVIPGTTNRIVIDPPQHAAKDERPIVSVTVKSGGGHCSQLEYPKGLSPSERADAQSRLSPLTPELAQQLLDELAARLKAGTIRVSPLVYLIGLIKRANAGRFVPEAGLNVADAREKRKRNEAYLQKLHALNDASKLQEVAVEDSPLARRLADIQLRSADRSKDN
jgi:hypothetical protein